MKYLRSIIIGIVTLVSMVSISVFVFYWSKDSCPTGTFACGENHVCIPRRNVCDNRDDCPNAEDENPAMCFDFNGSGTLLNKIFNISRFPFKTFWNTTATCELDNYPDGCVCKRSTKLFCKDLGLTEVPQDITGPMTNLILANNSIKYLKTDSFSQYNLKLIHLEGNYISYLQPGIFSKQTNLQKLYFMRNKITTIEHGVFKGLHKLMWLFLDENRLVDFNLENLKDLKSVEWINMSKNLLKLQNGNFPDLPNLLELIISFNKIEVISEHIFDGLTNLEYLDLHKNQIRYIHKNAFKNMVELEELNLLGNELEELEPSVFEPLTFLSKLYLGHNPLKHIPVTLFEGLYLLQSLNLDNIEIDNIDVEMFSMLTELESVYFMKYAYCSYAPLVPRCRPLSDGVSSTEHLLVKPILRYTAWVICSLTFVGNCLVLWGRHIFRDDNKAQSFLIRNLAISDMLMGIYLFVISVQDVQFRNLYNQNAQTWMSSWSCTATGILAMTSSEVSVLILVFMSVERYFLIADPFGRRTTLSMPEAFFVISMIWTIGIGLAVIPVFQWHTSTRYYGVNGMCFPLHIHDPFLVGWQYSALIFIGLNAIGVIIIATAYLGMFISIYRTRTATPLPLADYEFAVRFFFIVLTDAACWIPIITIKILAYLEFEISVDVYAWLVIVVLPFNSAINPLLYTFTTPKYRTFFFKRNNQAQNRSREKNTTNERRRMSPHSNAGKYKRFPRNGARRVENQHNILIAKYKI